MIRAVQYAKTLDGKMIAVEQGPHQGWALGDTVYATKEEAQDAAGRLSAQAYIDEQAAEIDYGLSVMIDHAGAFDEWRNRNDAYERRDELVADILRDMFPTHGPRPEHAKRFADAFVLANAAYEELHAK